MVVGLMFSVLPEKITYNDWEINYWYKNSYYSIIYMEKHSLDLEREEFQQLLTKGNELVIDQFSHLETRKAYHFYPQKVVEQWFDEELPEHGMEADQLLGEVKQKILDPATYNLGPNMYAYVMAGGTQVSIVAEQLAATVNQNPTKWHLGPSMAELEKRVVQWAADMLGYGKEIGGVMVSGGSAANLAGLTVARNIYFERSNIRQKGLFGLSPLTVYASKEVHSCIAKSLELLGIGSDQLRLIDTNPDFTINLDDLEKAIQEDLKEGNKPFCIVGTAGTVNTGAIDDMNALADLAQAYAMWFHVDGAYGGLAATLDSMKGLYRGMERANSLAIDFHKWLYQPFEAGCVLVQNWDILKRTYFKKADYLDAALEGEQSRLNFNEHYFQLSRNAKALKVWMSLKFYGMAKMRDMIQKDIDLARYLADEVDQSSDFELKARSPLAIACFRYVGKMTDEEEILGFNQLLIPALEKDGRVFMVGTKLNGAFVLRACLINHRMHRGTVDYLLTVIREVAEGVRMHKNKDVSPAIS